MLSQKHPEKVTPISKKSEKTLPIYRGYFPNDTPLCCWFLKKVRKNIHPLSGVFPKRHPVALLLLEKIQKKSSPHHWLSQFPPCFVTPFFNFFKKFLSLHCWLSLFCLEKVTPVQKIFQKKTPHCWLSHFFCVLFLHSWKKSWKILPIGNKKLIAGYNQQQSSRTGIFWLGSIVRNMHILLPLNWIYQNTTLNYV